MISIDIPLLVCSIPPVEDLPFCPGGQQQQMVLNPGPFPPWGIGADSNMIITKSLASAAPCLVQHSVTSHYIG